MAISNTNGSKLEEFITYLYKKQNRPKVEHNVVITTSYDPNGNQIDVLYGKKGAKTLVECKYKTCKVGLEDVSQTLAKVKSLNHARKSKGSSKKRVPHIKHVEMVTNSDYVDRVYIYLNGVVKKELKRIKVKGFQLYNGFDLEGEYYRSLNGWKGRRLRKLWKKVKPLNEKIRELQIERTQYRIKHRKNLSKKRHKAKLKSYTQKIQALKEERVGYITKLSDYKRKKKIGSINHLIRTRRY